MEKFKDRVYVKELKEYFKLEQVTGDEESLMRWIIVPDVNRPGLELTGANIIADLKRVNILGNKELDYLKEFDYETQKQRYQIITDSYTPCIIVAHNNDVPKALIEMANDRNFPVFKSGDPSYRVSVDVSAYLDSRMAPSESVHGVLMNIYGFGVLITGESGVGKSELALELIRRGHALVGDDRIEIKKLHNELYGQAHKLLKNYLEIRGIGIIDVGLMYGASVLLESCAIDLNIHLTKFDQAKISDRLGQEAYKHIAIMEIEIPSVELPVKEGRAMGALVETAVINFRLRKKGFNSGEKFLDEIAQAIKENRGN